MSNHTDSNLTLKLNGSRIDKPDVPALLRAGEARGAPAGEDPFLPADYLRVVGAFDLSAGGRSAPTAQREVELEVSPGQLLALELPDGTTLITSSPRFQEELQRVAPEAVGRGAVTLDDVQPRGAASRGLLSPLGRLVSKVFVLDCGSIDDIIIREALDKVREWAGDTLADKLRDGAYWGIDYLATRALMWAVESRLPREPGLYRWMGADKTADDLLPADDQRLADAVRHEQQVLVLIHGTGSSTSGSFGDLRTTAREAQLDWDSIEDRYGDNVYGFEHRTFSESPIENALLLARTLPAGAKVDLVTHSRGGIVGDLLCVDWSDMGRSRERIKDFARFRTQSNRNAMDLDKADEKDRRDLLALATELREKRIVVDRYVRVAAPVNGTLLAGSNLDLFLSSLLTLFGLATTLQASPFYMALKRIVLEIVRNRTDAIRVPGLEALLPGSAVSRLLRVAPAQSTLRLGVVAGDTESASRFKRLVEFLADWAIFERMDNDLVVDTASMDSGVARPQNARRLFIQGPQVDHFSYFGNADSRSALAEWLTAEDPDRVHGFDPLVRRFEEPRQTAEPAGRSRGSEDHLPIVIVVPGIMGSHLQIGSDRVWFDPLDIMRGGLQRLAYTQKSLAEVRAEKLFDMFYGDLCQYLEKSHRVVRFPYDWRLPVQRSAEELARELRAALAETRSGRLPVRILAHSMGGLVTRAMAAAEPALWEEFLSRAGSRFVMLGTPNQGSHLMVETLLGKADAPRRLAMLDLRHDLQEVLDVVAGFRGALQLLPRPGFRDSGGTPVDDYYRPKTWRDLRPQVFDFWFGDGKVGVPDEGACAEAGSLWALPDFREARVPGRYPEKVLYVCGKASNTPCGIQLAGGRVKMVGTREGDGSVSWASGCIEGIGAAYLMDAAHGDLVDTEEHFESLAQLLTNGTTEHLARGWPGVTVRGGAPATIVYDAGPVSVPTDEEAACSLLGAIPRRQASRREPPAVLQVNCAAMDVRHAMDPILVGHYEQDAISGPEAIIDQDIVCNELTMRKHLGSYPSAIGTAEVVLMDRNEEERLRDSWRGAVVAGLGEWGKLTTASLTEAISAAVLRYLLAVVELHRGESGAAEGDGRPISVGLSSLLLGFSSTANISIADSVRAIVIGVLEANRRFADAHRGPAPARIVRLEIIECFLDIAISAMKALQDLEDRLKADAPRLGARVSVTSELKQGRGARPRLEALSSVGYWHRLIVTSPPVRDDEKAVESSVEPGPVEPGRKSPAIARKLRYVFLSQRARAESECLQYQPGLLESLVRLSSGRQDYDRDLSRTLFQLLVPVDFKETARQVQALALLVDEYTADMPWELLCADDQPLITRTAIVRQLENPRWRRGVRSTIDKVAYVVGNPSTKGFAQAFPTKANRGNVDPRPLPGAEAEAYAVSALLTSAGYEMVESIGLDQSALDVINRLFLRPYRIVHIAAHGEFNIEAADGSRRSGVLLSDGLMLTAAEIGQMEIVPDLVFINCCHLGKIDDRPAVRGVEYNKLASSFARELIEMGVRAVIVAGWAIDDRAGEAFARAFYRYFIQDGQTFGWAVQKARLDTYHGEFKWTNTWGAFQAYGDAGFLIDPNRPRDAGGDGHEYAAPQELLDRLARIRDRLQLPAHRAPRETLPGLQREIRKLLEDCPAEWKERGDVLYAKGAIFAEYGTDGFELARECFLEAVETEEDAERVPIKAIEQLANMEVRIGDRTGEEDGIKRGGERLLGLSQVVASEPGDPHGYLTAERCGLLGSAWKRQAEARRRGGESSFREALEASRDWYARGEGKPNTATFSPYCAVNRLMLDGILGTKVDRALARKARAVARQRFKETRDYWDAMIPADARLTEFVAAGIPGDADAEPTQVEAVVDAYRQARRSVLENAKNWDSVVRQIELLAGFAAALGRNTLAASLNDIALRLRPDANDGEARSPKQTLQRTARTGKVSAKKTTTKRRKR